MSPGNKAFGGVSLPLKTEVKRAGDLPHQPPVLPRQSALRDHSRLSQPEIPGEERMDLISIKAELDSIKANCAEHRRKDSGMSRTADTAKNEAHIANWKMNGALALMGLTFGTVVTLFTVLFNRQTDASKDARTDAKLEARNTMLEYRSEMMQTLRSERDETARLAAKKALEEQSRMFAAQKDPDVVTVRKP